MQRCLFKPREIYSQSPEGIGGFNHPQNVGPYFGGPNPQRFSLAYSFTIVKGE
jgi:hypothetical protein